MTWLDLIGSQTLSGIAGLVLGGIITLLAKRRETAASIQDVWTKSTSTLIEQYTHALDAARIETAGLRKEIADMRGEISALEDHVDVLKDALEARNIPAPGRGRRSGRHNG